MTAVKSARKAREGAAPRRRAAGVPARRAVPELAVQESGLLRPLPAAGYSHHAYTLPPGPTTSPPEPTTSRSASLARLVNALEQRRRARTRSRRPADLPDRVRRAEHAQHATSGSRSPSRPSSTRSPRTSPGEPARRGLLAVPAQDDPLGGPPGRASTAASSASRPAWSTSTASPSRCTARGRCRWSSPSTATATRCGGSCGPADRRHQGDVLVRRAARKKYGALKTVTTNSARLLELHLDAQGVAWRVRWISPSGRQVRRPADRAPTERGRSPARRGSARGSAYDGRRCRSCPRSRSPRGGWTRRCAGARSSPRSRRGSTR